MNLTAAAANAGLAHTNATRALTARAAADQPSPAQADPGARAALLEPTVSRPAATAALGAGEVRPPAAEMDRLSPVAVADAEAPGAHAPSPRNVASGTAHRSAHARGPARTPAALAVLPPAGQPGVIDHFVEVIPSAIWLALGLALSVAASAGGLALRASRRARRQAGELAAAEAAAHTDSLTDSLNRRGFIDAVERELARARRYDGRFVLAYLDVRGLKTLNDTEGHPAGDALLREVAHLLNDSARDADVVGRIGGDEFAVLLTEQTADSADAVTQRIRELVGARRRELRLSVPWDLTIGTAAYPHDGRTFDQLMATADRRLYEQRGIEIGARARVS